MIRRLVIGTLLFLVPLLHGVSPALAQVNLELSVGGGVAIPDPNIAGQVNGNGDGTNIKNTLFGPPGLAYEQTLIDYLQGEPFDASDPYNERLRLGVSGFADLTYRHDPHYPITIGVSAYGFRYTGLVDLHYYPFAGGEDKIVTYLSSNIRFINLSASVGYETWGPTRFGIYVGPLLQFQRTRGTTYDLIAVGTDFPGNTHNAVGFFGRVSLAHYITPFDELLLNASVYGARLNVGHPDNAFFYIAPTVNVGVRFALNRKKSENPSAQLSNYFQNGIYSGCYGYDPERKIDSLLHLVDSLGKELNDAVKGLEDNGFTKEVRAIEALLEIARLANSSGGLSQAGMHALGDYIQCNDTALVKLIKSGSSGAGQVIKGMKFLKDILEFIAENNKHITASEKKLLQKVVKAIGDQLDKLEKALDDKNVDLAISILKTIKEGLPDGWPNDLLDHFAKGLLKELEDAIAEAGPKAVKKILETILKKLTGSGAAAASLAEDAYNFIDLLYRLAVYHDALDEFNEAFVNLLEELKANGKGLSTGLSCHTDWGGQDKRITKLVTEFELVCWCPEEPGSKTDGEWKSTACEIEPSDATNPHQHTHPIGAGSFGSKNYKVHFPEDRPCDSKLCYLKHTVYGYDKDGNLIQKVSTFLGVAN